MLKRDLSCFHCKECIKSHSVKSIHSWRPYLHCVYVFYAITSRELKMTLKSVFIIYRFYIIVASILTGDISVSHICLHSTIQCVWIDECEQWSDNARLHRHDDVIYDTQWNEQLRTICYTLRSIVTDSVLMNHSLRTSKNFIASLIHHKSIRPYPICWHTPNINHSRNVTKIKQVTIIHINASPCGFGG